ncbi:phosphate ABC transporter permease PstA [Halomicrococcus sp. NG-SE-24]|uniref:phosphate ABC transporter permease PstA n=1 Tax=Halomicrococcus sp. NG-SE-24 TaxID=3436928 RepID=UPI003D97AB23
MSYGTDAVAAEESSTNEAISATVAGVSILTVMLGLTTLFRWTNPTGKLAGVALFDLFGLVFAMVGVGVGVLGVASYAGLFDTSPDRSAGLVTGGLFGLVGTAAAGLFASQTLGFGLLGWLAVALVGGAATAVATVLPREDLGSTVPAAALALLVGVVVLGDVITPSWRWSPEGFAVGIGGDIAIPVLAVFVGLVTAWSAAKAYDGFGTQGRQTGAYMLVSLNALGMLGVLLLVISFVFDKGWAPATRGIEFGLFTAPVFWIDLPFFDQYVVIEAPGIRFHWPFTMTGYTLSPDEVNGIFAAVVGTFWVVAGAVAFAVPLGVGAAVFLTEYAEQGGFTRVVEIATNGLWSTPSIVYGLFGYAFLVPRLGNSTSLVAGILVLGFMLLPLVLITSREAIKTVPDEYRDASAALGVSQWETIRSVVLPAAMPGVITGVILGVGRIAGETAPLILVMAGGLRAPAPNVLGSFEFSLAPPFVTNEALMQSALALPYKVYALINTESLTQAWGAAFVLLLVVLTFYVVGVTTRIYFRRKLRQ